MAVIYNPWDEGVRGRTPPAPQFLGPPPGLGGGGGGGAPPGPPASPSISFGGFTPDYKALVAGDPLLVQAQGDINAQRDAAGASRQAAIRTALTRFGGVPTGLQDPYGDVDQATKDAAANNPFSVVNQLKQWLAKNQGDLTDSLAARGMLQSGGLRSGTEMVQREYGQQEYNETNTLLDFIKSVISGYAGKLNELAGLERGEIGEATQRAYNNPANRPIAPTQATLLPGSEAAYGRPVYRSEDGRLWNVDGTPFVEPVYQPPPPPPPSAPLFATPADDRDINPIFYFK